MPMSWNDQADAKLLVGILKTGNPKLDYDALAKYMGADCTAYAIQHRLRKLKDKADGKNSGGSAPNTPTKRKKDADDEGKGASGTPKKVKNVHSILVTNGPNDVA